MPGSFITVSLNSGFENIIESKYWNIDTQVIKNISNPFNIIGVFIGFYLGCVGLYAAGQDSRLGAVWLILMMPFIVDATCTLLIRLAQGKSPVQGHSDHTYQRLKRASDSVLVINVGLLGLQVLWQIPMAIWAVFGSYSPVFAVIFATIPSLVLVAYSRR